MDLDTNQLCPGGTGKKIRFCCKDLVRELDRIVRLMEGGQRRAAVEAIDQTLKSKGDRACLHALKAEALVEAGDSEAALAAMSTYAEKFPDNPAALAEGAIVATQEGRVAEAVNLLQSAIERSGEKVDSRIYTAVGIVAQGLLMDNNLPACLAHVRMQVELSRGRDREPLEMLDRLQRASPAPLLLKFPLDLETEVPAGAAWQNALSAAVEVADRGEWRKGLAAMRALADNYPSQPVLLKNIALLESRLGDRTATARAWRDYAALADLPWEDRVEAEAIAQLLEPLDEEDHVDEVKLTYGVRDVDRLLEALLSDPRLVQFEGDLEEFAGENDTPPKCALSILDRSAKLDEGQELTVDTVPNVLGGVFVFGKRTDRDARLELEVTRNEDFQAAQKILTEAGKEWLGPIESEEVVGSSPLSTAALSWSWRFPNEATVEQREKLMTEMRRKMFFERWPETPRPRLDGKTPREAASQEPYRLKVAAGVLLLEAVVEHVRWREEFEQLRERLGLPPLAAIDPATTDLTRLPIIRFARLPVEQLSDENLLLAFGRALEFHPGELLQRIAREVLRRESLADKADPLEVHHVLAQCATDAKEGIEHLRKCRELKVQRGESPAAFLIEELRYRLLRREGVEQCEGLMRELHTKHQNERGVAEALYGVLLEFGIITPDGRMAGGMQREAKNVSESAATTPPERGALWTPDQPTAPAPEKKSKLWMPGMD